MNIYQSEALTLRTYPFGESHKIAVFLTGKFGKVRGVAHGALKGRGRFGSSLEPLTHLVLTFSRKETQELSVIQSCEIIRAVITEELTWELSLYWSYFAELFNEFSQEQQESQTVFRLGLAVLGAAPGGPLDLMARYLELWLLQLDGVLPKLEDRLSAETAEKTRDMMKRHPTQIQPDNFSAADRKRLETVCVELVEYHLEKRLKTRKLLKQLL